MANRDPDSSSALGGGQFPNTASLWSSVIGPIGQGDATRGEAAMARLCQLYWYPIYAYLRRQRDNVEHGSFSHHRAQDYAQGFFAHLIEKNTVARAQREKGRFRSFLLGALSNHVANEQDKERAGKRGGGETPVSLDADLPFDSGEAEERYRLEPRDDTELRSVPLEPVGDSIYLAATVLLPAGRVYRYSLRVDDQILPDPLNPQR